MSRLLVLAPPDFAALACLRDADVDFFVSDDPATVWNAVPEAEIVLLGPRSGNLIRHQIIRMKNVRWIHSLAAGVDNLPLQTFSDMKVTLTNGRGIFGPALAEFVIGAMLYFAKDLRRIVENQRKRQWAPFTVRRLEGSTLGIIGFGSIGRRVAALARDLGVTVIGMRRRAEADPSIVPLKELLTRSDYVVITAPLTEDTRGMIGTAELALMKRDAVLINVGRGAIVEEEALLSALDAQAIRGAALDVFATEPLPPEHPLWALENVLLSPHCADYTGDSHGRAMKLFLDNYRRYSAGEPLENVVDLAAGY